MVPAITEGGRSFKGAALYYLHDKRQPGEAERDRRPRWLDADRQSCHRRRGTGMADDGAYRPFTSRPESRSRHLRTPRSAYDLNRATTAANDQLGVEFKQLEQKQKDAQLHAQERQILQSQARNLRREWPLDPRPLPRHQKPTIALYGP
jgi:hypothetical protein